VARWIYVSNENPSACGNHQAATSAGLPAAPVPGSLLVAIAEQDLFGDQVPSGRLAATFGVPVFAGENAVVERSGDAVVFRTARGVALEAELR